MSVYVKQSGAWEETDALYVKQSGSWTTIKEVYVKESGNWRKAAPDTGNYSQTSAGSGSFVVPAMVTEINITSIVAAGGGGSAVWFCGDGFPGGGGGSGGFQTSQTLAVVPGETVNVTVGAGGAPSSFVLCGGAANGSAGGSSSITTSAGSITVTVVVLEVVLEEQAGLLVRVFLEVLVVLTVLGMGQVVEGEI